MYRVCLLAYGMMGPYALKGLLTEFSVLGVVIPKKTSRYFSDHSASVLALCEENTIEYHYDEGLGWLESFILEKNPDVVLIASYNKIIPQHILTHSTFINVHHGDLPRYRGRANINWAIINGREEIGITIHQVIPELDAGDYYAMWKIPIGIDDYISTVYENLNFKIQHELPELLINILKGRVTPIKQIGEPSYCCTRLPSDGKIDWSHSAKAIYNLIRAVSRPFSGAFSYLNGLVSEKIVIWKAHIEKAPRCYEGNIPGRVARILPGIGAEVLTKDQPIIITEVEYAGKISSADQIFSRNLSDTLS